MVTDRAVVLGGGIAGLTVTGGRTDGVIVSQHDDGGEEHVAAGSVVVCSARSSRMGAWPTAMLRPGALLRAVRASRLRLPSPTWPATS